MKKNLLLLTIFISLISFNAMSQCGQISLIGEFNEWADDLVMERNPVNPDLFTATITFTAGDDQSDPPDGIIELKFRENADWTNNWGSVDFPSGTGIIGGDNIPVPIGSYIVSFNCSTGEYNFESTCGTISMIGEFNEWSDDYAMVRDAVDPDVWITTVTFGEGDDTSEPPDGIIELKFRENADWTNNWGSVDFPSGTGVIGGDNIPVPIGSYLVTFNCSTGEYNFQLTCGEISLIGEFNEWADDFWMTRGDDPDTWTVLLSLSDEDDTSDPPDGIVELKFRENADWAVNWGSADFPTGTGTNGGDNIPVILDETGLTTDYLVTFNCATGEYSFEATTGAVSMIGAFIGWDGDIPMNRDAVNPNLWTLTRSWFEDSEVKFRENADWSVNWGSDTWPTGTGTENGPNIPLVAGTYDVTFNSSTFDYGFVENTEACGEIGMVGDFNEWGDDGSGVPTDVYLVRDAVYPNLFSLEYNFTSGTNLLFRVDCDATFQNVWGGDFPSGVAVQDPSHLFVVPGGLYNITFNCVSGDFCFTQLGNSVNAPKVFAMDIDGYLDENDWVIDKPISKIIEGTVGENPTEGLFGVTYNDEYLYVGVEVYTATVAPEDVVEIFVDGNKSGGAYDDSDIHFTVSSDGVVTVITGPASITPIGANSSTDTSYFIEAGILWAELGVTPVEGMIVGFDVIIDEEGTYKLAWNGNSENATSTSGFGDMTLGQLSCGCISLYGETIGDIGLNNPTDMPTTYTATYEFFADNDVVFRKDYSNTVAWGETAFPSGTAVVGGDAIPATTGRYRVTFDCLTGTYSFADEVAGDSTAYTQYTETAPVIDGDLSEYDLAYGMDAGVVAGTGPDNNTVTWGSVWDQGSFYIGVKVVDAVVEGSGNPWDNDAIEFYIDGNHDEDGAYDADFDTQLILDFVGQSELWIKADGVPITNFESNWTATDDGYNVELRLGWDNFSFYPGQGRSIGWSIGNNDSDNGIGRDYQTAWFGTGSNWCNTGDLGDLQLQGGPYFFGIEDIKNYNSQVVLFPNPSNGNVYLRMNSDVFGTNVNIYITDLSGRTIMVNSTATNDLVKLNTNQLLPGVYLVNIRTIDGKNAIKKLIIQ